MKQIYIFLTGLAFLSAACGPVQKENHEEEHHHQAEGVVLLTKQQQNALGLKLGHIQMRNLTTVVKTNGQLMVPPSGSAEVTALFGGNVKEIAVFHGDKVKKGQLLARLIHPDYITIQENFAEAASNLEFQKKELERQQELYDNNVGSGKALQQATSNFNITKAKYEGLKSRLDLLNIDPDDVLNGKISGSIRILSPINGFVNQINIKSGSYVDARDIMFEITDNADIHADFLVYEKDVPRVKPGQKIHFDVANQTGKEYLATIFAVGKVFEPETRAVHIHATLDEPDESLIPGLYISGHIHTDAQSTPALPNDAIVSEGTKSFIFIKANEDGDSHEEESTEFKMIEVVAGRQDGDFTAIKLIDSVPENAEVVLNAAYYLLADMNKEETEHEH
ncbi:efflux RND transporter periplasmic adaptor subunit [Saccharicrinis sp. FJH54]|uniref:efflux RND transporter periplasmic adaptor subunit n=1 Tax=Saccharicrinis sp. FJH54 TaxID=3344665 RepID=UPI0035D3E61F